MNKQQSSKYKQSYIQPVHLAKLVEVSVDLALVKWCLNSTKFAGQQKSAKSKDQLRLSLDSI